MSPDESGGVQGLGELALRVDDLEAMTAFYRDVVGLSVLREFDDVTFFDIADGYGGHTTILALFDRAPVDDRQAVDEDEDEEETEEETQDADGSGDRYVPPDAAATTVDHFAFTIDLDDLDGERRRLERHGVDLDFATHEWVSWRSLYFDDPEGNRVEFVCYDETIGEN